MGQRSELEQEFEHANEILANSRCNAVFDGCDSEVAVFYLQDADNQCPGLKNEF